MTTPAPTLAAAPTAEEVAAIADPIERAQLITGIARACGTLSPPLAALRRQTIFELRTNRPVGVIAALLALSPGRISQMTGGMVGGQR